MASDHTYSSSLAQFVDKKINQWADDKKKIIEPKLRANYDAVTNEKHLAKLWKKGEAQGWRSDTHVGLVRVKVWSYYAIFIEAYMRGGKIPFVLDPSPYDERYMPPEMLKDRDKRLDKMTAKIESQLTLRNADREFMKEVLSTGYYGMAAHKFNVEDVENIEFRLTLPGVDIKQAMQMVPYEELMKYARYELDRSSEPVPGHKYVSMWSLVWDLDSETLQDGDGYAEHIPSCPYDLLKLKGKPGYIDEAIDNAIQSNRDKHDKTDGPSEVPGKEELKNRSKTITRFEFYMRAPRKYVDEFEKRTAANIPTLSLYEQDEEYESSGDDVEIMGEMAEKEIIRLIRNETGKRPHRMWVLERDLDKSTGRGIADNMDSLQQSFVGMLRAFEDNKKLSANVTAAVKERYFNDPGQLREIQPGKTYDIADACDDVRKAILPIVFPDVGESLMSGIQLMLQFDDKVSMIPTIMQGFNLPKHGSDTAFEIQQLTQNAGKYIGQAIRNADEESTEPKIKDIYEYNMLFDDDEPCKVNCKVKANGFTSFQNKELRGARLQQVLGMMISSEVLAPHIEIKPHLEIIYESVDEDPERFIKSDEKMDKEAQRTQEMQAQAQATALKMAIAQAALQTKQEVAIKDKEHQDKLAENAQEHQFDMQEADKQHEHKLIETLSAKRMDGEKRAQGGQK